MFKNTLFFCRTPLQAILINKILQDWHGNSHVIYRPNNKSAKHQYYFQKLQTEHKTWLAFEPITFSHTLSSIFDWFSLSKEIRQKKYDYLFIASIGDIVFSFFAARNKLANIYLFDDGTFNLNKRLFLAWIAADSTSNRVVRKLLNGEKANITFNRITHYFTIYSSAISWLKIESTKINDLFEFDDSELAHSSNKPQILRVLLGSAYMVTEAAKDPAVIATQHALHERIITSGKFDIYIPHPSHPSKQIYPESFKEILANNPFELMIAEDIISTIYKEGYQLIIYGFNSSALVNLAKDFRTVSFALDENIANENAAMLKSAGAKVIKVF